MLKNKNLLVLIVLFFMILSVKEAYAFAGAYCANASECTCGIQCKGGYEFANLYNTIDGCPDGPDFNYEDVENITIKALNSTFFAGGKTAEITVDFKTASGDSMRILYNNGSGFYTLFNGTCNVNGSQIIKLNITINKAIGNHTLRAFINYPDKNYTGQTCGYNMNDYYSDTDDIMFFVGQGETVPPTITNITPSGTTYSLEDSIPISANITDNDFVKSAYVNITTPIGSVISLNMTSTTKDYFNTTFSNAQSEGEYNYAIIGIDDSQNSANASGKFYIDYSINISIKSPINGGYYNHTDLILNMTIIDRNYTIDSLSYELNGASNITLLPLHESYDDSIMGVENNSEYDLSQSFNSSIDLDVRKVLLKIQRTGIDAQAMVLIRTDSFGPGATIAYGVINSSISETSNFQPAFLNQSVHLQANQKYWITITQGTVDDFFVWSYGINYSRGESEYEPEWDYMFYLLDESRFEKNITISESNELKIFVNNTAGVQKQKMIEYYYDISTPYFVSTNYSAQVEYGTDQHFYAVLEDNFAIDTCLLEIDGANITMDRAEDKEFFLDYSAEQGPRTFKLYFNDSAGHKNNTDYFDFFVNDTRAPLVTAIHYSPNTTEWIDPNATIVVSAGIYEAGSLNSVILEFGESQALLNSINMTNIGGNYQANFTPQNQATYFFRVYAQDEFGNYNTSAIHSINVSFDQSYRISPLILGTKGSIIGKNASLGNISVNNTGDYDLEMNFFKSQDTTPDIFFSENPISIPAHTEIRINISAISPNIEASYPIGIIANSSVRVERINATLITQRGGAYLLAEYTDIPSKITVGNKGNNITAKITNIGNETADNVSYNWILPSDWSTRNNLTGLVGTLISGAEMTIEIKADVGDAAVIGANIISLFVNSTSNTSSLLEKSVAIENIEQAIIESPPSNSQSGGGGVTGLNAPLPRTSGGAAKALFDSASSANLTIGDKTRIEINITNNNRYITWSDFKISTDGFPMNLISIDDDGDYDVGFQSTKRFFLTFDVPQYNKEESIVLKIRMDAHQYDEKVNLSSEVVFRKEINLFILKKGIAGERFCTEYAESDLDKLRMLDFGTEKMTAMLDSAKEYIKNGRFEDARKICMDIKSAKERAEKISIELALIEQSIDEMKKEYYDVGLLQVSLNTAKSLFFIGNLEAAEDSMSDLRYSLAIKANAKEGSVKRIGTKVVRDYLASLILGLISASLIGTLVYSEGGKIKRRIRKESYARDEKKIIELVKKAQKEYYEDKSIGRSLYEASMKEYRERLAKIIEKKLKIKIAEEIKNGKNPSLEREMIIKEVRELQDDYYVKRTIDSRYYDEMNKMLNDRLYEIDVKIGAD